MGGSSSKNFAVIDCIKADTRQNLITLKVIKAIYKVDGFFGFYRCVFFLIFMCLVMLKL